MKSRIGVMSKELLFYCPTYAYKTCITTGLISPLPTHFCWKKVTKICSSIGDPVGVDVAVAVGDKDTTGTRQTVERVTCPAAGTVPDIQDSCLPGLTSGQASCLRPSAAANAMSFSPMVLMGASWCYCLEFGDRNSRPS